MINPRHYWTWERQGSPYHRNGSRYIITEHTERTNGTTDNTIIARIEDDAKLEHVRLIAAACDMRQALLTISEMLALGPVGAENAANIQRVIQEALSGT